jgi:hypothetical protein
MVAAARGTSRKAVIRRAGEVGRASFGVFACGASDWKLRNGQA